MPTCVQIASAEIDWLYDYIAESGYALVLTDAERHRPVREDRHDACRYVSPAGLMAGADWSEHSEGTNGIGTCIAENRPVIVHREEHFRTCHIGLSCSGSPIHDPAGRLVAVLDASTLNARRQRSGLAHTMALVNLSARLIEKCLFLRHFEQGTVFRFHARPEFVNLQHDGAIALADDATVVAADELRAPAGRQEPHGPDRAAVSTKSSMCAPQELVDPPAPELLGLRPVRDVLLGRKFFANLDHGTARRALESSVMAERLERVLQLAPAASRKSPLTLEQLAGEDPQMLRNVRSAHRIAISSVPVMIQGPTGAGKEMFARALHAASGRALSRSSR